MHIQPNSLELSGQYGELSMRQCVFFSLTLLFGCGDTATRPLENSPTIVEADSQSETVALETDQAEPPKTSFSTPLHKPWSSEDFSQQVDKHFKGLSQALVVGRRTGRENTDAALNFIAEDAVSDLLRPDRLTTIRDETGYSVRRWQATTDDSPLVSKVSGRNEIWSQFQQLAAGNNTPESDESLEFAKSQFKIVSVTRLDRVLETDVIWQSMVESQRERIQRSSNWRCHWVIDDNVALSLKTITVTSFEEVSFPIERQFVDVAGSATKQVEDFKEQFGYDIDYWYDRLEHRIGIMATGYQGISVADVNGDGLDDVFIPQPGGVVGGLPNRLLVQQPDGSVVDRSAASGLDWLIETHSALFVDFDNDGDQDVVVATVMGLVFASNDGTGKFQRRAVKLTPDAPPMSLAAADFDNDQDLDLYVCCYAPRTSSPLMGRPVPYHDANNGGRNLLLRNDRDWRFRDVTKTVGMNMNNRRFSFAASWEDFDNDGDLDIYVANDYGRNNLFENEGGSFRDIAADLQVEDISAGMSVSWGDYDRDGWMDLYVSNMWSSAGKRIAFQRSFQPVASESTKARFKRHARGNSLFANRLGQGHRSFNDVSVAANVTMGRWAWCSKFADINNDGYEDLLVTNGFITQEKTDDL